MSRTRGGDITVGVIFCTLIVLGLFVAVLAYNRVFVPSSDILLRAGTIGNALQEGSDVKLNGVPVGKVSAIEPTDDGTLLTLALDPGTARGLPRDTVARLLPKTLFGERYVQLRADGATSGGGLHSGDTIDQDQSDEAVEFEQVMDELLPVLQAIQPEKLAASLGELSSMLRGRGDSIGDTMQAWGDYLTKLDPYVPQITEDLQKFAEVADTYNVAAPDLLAALDDFTTTSKTIVDQRTKLTDLYANVITGSRTTREWLEANSDTIIILSEESRAALEATAPYARQFPCLFKATRRFIPQMDTVLGAGTDEPGVHVTLNVVPDRGRYLAGVDEPTFATGGKPRCPYVTGASSSTARSSSKSEPDSIAPPPSGLLREQLADAAGLGDANSPGENRLFAELLAPERAMAPADYPEWSSLVVGPTLRKTVVTLR